MQHVRGSRSAGGVASPALRDAGFTVSLDQRYYASNYGRFLTPDRFRMSAHLSDPRSWNRYMYSDDDSINLNDPDGLCPPGYVSATSTTQLQGIVNTAESYVGQGLEHSGATHFTTNSGGSLTAIDCTGLLMEALAGIGYTSGVFQAASNLRISYRARSRLCFRQPVRSRLAISSTYPDVLCS